jgi:hypothetical protein
MHIRVPDCVGQSTRCDRQCTAASVEVERELGHRRGAAWELKRREGKTGSRRSAVVVGRLTP